jgi:hypothetical protein
MVSTVWGWKASITRAKHCQYNGQPNASFCPKFQFRAASITSLELWECVEPKEGSMVSTVWGWTASITRDKQYQYNKQPKSSLGPKAPARATFVTSIEYYQCVQPAESSMVSTVWGWKASITRAKHYQYIGQPNASFPPKVRVNAASITSVELWECVEPKEGSMVSTVWGWTASITRDKQYQYNKQPNTSLGSSLVKCRCRGGHVTR